MNIKDLAKETDENLLFLFVSNKNRAALDVLFERHMASAYHIAYKFMHNQADAEDVVQKAFINVMRFADTKNQQGMVKAWIMKTVINTSKNEIKHLIRQRKLLQNKSMLQPSEYILNENDTSELRKILISAIEQLLEHFRWPIWLIHYENMTIKEASHALGKSENTIRTQISRGLEKLEQSLKIHGTKLNNINIILLLGECKKIDQVPESLLAKVKAVSSLKDSTRLAVSTSSKKSYYLLSISLGIGVILFIAGFWLLSKKEVTKPNQQNNSNSMINKTVSPLSAIEKDEELNLFWDFSTKEAPSWCKILKGNFEYVNSKDNRGQYLRVLDKNDFIIKLDFPVNDLPFKVSYDIKIDPIGKDPFKINSLSEINKIKGVTFAFQSKVKEKMWMRVEIFVQKNIQAIYYDQQLMFVVASEVEFDTSPFIHLNGSSSNIDNLKIKRLKENELKDFSKCIELSKKYMQNDTINYMEIPSTFSEIKKGNIHVYWKIEK